MAFSFFLIIFKYQPQPLRTQTQCFPGSLTRASFWFRCFAGLEFLGGPLGFRNNILKATRVLKGSSRIVLGFLPCSGHLMAIQWPFMTIDGVRILISGNEFTSSPLTAIQWPWMDIFFGIFAESSIKEPPMDPDCTLKESSRNLRGILEDSKMGPIGFPKEIMD